MDIFAYIYGKVYAIGEYLSMRRVKYDLDDNRIISVNSVTDEVIGRGLLLLLLGFLALYKDKHRGGRELDAGDAVNCKTWEFIMMF